jgi:DNA-3-methyladenine glycosylase II
MLEIFNNLFRAIAAITQSDPILAAIIERVGACKLYQVQQTGDLFLALLNSGMNQPGTGTSPNLR